MTVVNYTAKRNIERNGFSINQSDIFCYLSFASAWLASNDYALGDYVEPTSGDNGFTYEVTTDGGSSSGTEPTWPLTDGGTVVDGGITWTARQKGLIKSSTTDLSIFPVDSWINTNGFTNVNNNGWYKVLSSSANQITIDHSLASLFHQDTGTILGIIGHHRGMGQSYDIEFDVSALTPQRNQIKNVRRAIGGNSTTVRHRTDKYHNLTATAIPESLLPQFEEFFDSVSSSESFNVDLRGTIVVPIENISCEIDGDESYSRINNSDFWDISFRVRKL